jgi:hypothetical protein
MLGLNRINGCLLRHHAQRLGVGLLLIVATTAHAATSVLSNPVVTDVTDRSLAVVWTSSERADPIIAVYSDAAATQPVTNAVVTAFPVYTGNPVLTGADRESSRQQIAADARNRGVMKVIVSGLAPSSLYYLKLSVDSRISQQATTCPNDGPALCPGVPVMAVTTEATATRGFDPGGGTTLFDNDQLLVSVTDGVSGDLLIVGVEGARYPVSVFIGDGVPAPAALIDLNNLYNASTESGFHVSGSAPLAIGDAGEVLVARHYRGTQGSVITYKGLPVAQGSGAVLDSSDVSLGDCNRDTLTNSYDHLLLRQVVVKNVNPADYRSLAFHPLLCDLYRESGADSLVTSPAIDVLDITLLEQLLVGRVTTVDMPQVP